ncbi:MAG TPA: phosphatase PAP2 family protein [Acidimicrobiales bacterium]
MILLVAYQAYRFVRAFIHGTAHQAAVHARQVIRLERALGIFHERAVQRPFVHATAFLRFWDTWYGAMHFAGPVVGLAVLYVTSPSAYRQWRNVLGFVLLASLVGFALYPLLPPRLLPPVYGFVDSGARYGGIGPIGKDVAAGALNAYAAMPSLHLAWSTWAACALWGRVRTRWARPLLLAWPLAMVFAVTVTANHYFVDCLAGVATVGVAYGLERARQALMAPRVR